jgi:hypothetical protein
MKSRGLFSLQEFLIKVSFSGVAFVRFLVRHKLIFASGASHADVAVSAVLGPRLILRAASFFGAESWL